MRLAVSLPVSRISDCSTVSQKRDFYNCCLTRHSSKPDDVQNPADRSIVFQRGSHRNCRTFQAQYLANAMFLRIIDLEDANYLDYSTISGNTTSGSDHVSDIVCLAEDDERLPFRLRPIRSWRERCSSILVITMLQSRIPRTSPAKVKSDTSPLSIRALAEASQVILTSFHDFQDCCFTLSLFFWWQHLRTGIKNKLCRSVS